MGLKDKLVEGLASDLLAMGDTSALALDGDYSSGILRALVASVKAFRETELTKEDKQAEKDTKAAQAALKDTLDAARVQAWQGYTESVNKAALDGKLDSAKLAALETTRETALEKAQAAHDAAQVAHTETLAKLANKRSDAAQVALFAALSTTSGTVNKTHAKLAESTWLVGPHRDGTGSLLASNPNVGLFVYVGATRELWFKPTGTAYKAAHKDSRPMGLAVDKWVKLGTVVDTKAANNLTGLQRYAYDVVTHASKYPSAKECIDATNAVAEKNNLANNNTPNKPHGNAGGTVFCTVLDSAKAKELGYTGTV